MKVVIGAVCGLVLLLTFRALPAVLPSSEAVQIVQRSVANTNADWAAAPHYNFTERDIAYEHGRRTTKTYDVLMIDGSPYDRLTAIDDRPLSPERAAEEERKLQQETARRKHESAGARHKRIAEYQNERHQDHALMAEMAKAFDYQLLGQENVDGRRCYVLAATPRRSYEPINRDTKVLKGMRGKMWIDTEQFQWVKVHAEVFRPVAFGLFIADVQPGTEFSLEQKPVTGNLWLPSHFSMRVQARVLHFWSKNSNDDETYTNYRRNGS
jgi:hypothetical protein